MKNQNKNHKNKLIAQNHLPLRLIKLTKEIQQ